ncbi:MAG: preprotein translocase subunit SecG, partial [Succinivibrio sp.]|nr:preprotein translocase subunit SecG [Succinivibrio sp.]
MYEIAIVVLLIIAIAMVALILVQQGKGAGMGASFGAGASNTVFGSVGSGNFLTRSTWVLILAFFGICLFIGWLQTNQVRESSDFSNIG